MRIPLARNRVRVAVITGTTAVLLAGAGVAWASIPDSSGVIHGCYASSGAMRVIDSATSKFKSTEKALSWNRQGKTGPTGARGPAGPAGAPGPAGPSGVSGWQLKSDTISLDSGQSGGRRIQCESGLLPLGGGYDAPPNTFRADVDGPVFESGFAGWNVVGQDLDSTPITVKVHVICAQVSP